MKRHIWAIGILLMSIAVSAKGQITAFSAETYRDDSGNSLKYRLLKPLNYDSTKKYPLVLFLHGSGERGSDNKSQLKWGVWHFATPEMREKYPAFIVAPQVPENSFWSPIDVIYDNTSSYTAPMPQKPLKPMRLTMNLLDQLQKRFPIDPKRLYVTGISMGGFGTFDLIERHPNKFAAAVPISGGGDISKAFFLKNMPIWVFHGLKDKLVNPKFSRHMVSAIRIAGGKPGYTEYPDEGHTGAWVHAYKNSHLYEWLFSKSLDSR